MLKLRKVEKITKKRKIKKFKKKKCTFEKLLIEFYDDDSKDMSSESEKVQISVNVRLKKNNFIQIIYQGGIKIFKSTRGSLR